MNIFFGIKSEDFTTSLNIPRFRNDISNSSNYYLFRLNIVKSNEGEIFFNKSFLSID